MSAPVPVGAVLPEVLAELRRSAVRTVIAAYASSVYRLLADLGDQLGLSLAYVDRPTIQAHLERELTAAEWQRVNTTFTAMDFDEHVGDAGRCRTDWIDAVLAAAGIDARYAQRPGPADSNGLGAAQCGLMQSSPS